MLETFFGASQSGTFLKRFYYTLSQLNPLNFSDLFPAAFNVNLKGMRKCTGMKGVNKRIKSDTKINVIKVYIIKELFNYI